MTLERIIFTVHFLAFGFVRRYSFGEARSESYSRQIFARESVWTMEVRYTDIDRILDRIVDVFEMIRINILFAVVALLLYIIVQFISR